MVGKGQIVKTCGKTAIVRIRKSSACGHDCGECRVCSNPEIEVEILNPVNAKPGDTVIIGTDTGTVLFSAFLLYILPIIGLLFVYMIADNFGLSIPIKAGLCVLFAIVWFLYMRYYSKNKVIQSCALEVVNEEN